MGILCTGEMLIDFTPVADPQAAAGEGGNTYKANPGGAPANVAVSAARNGIKAAFLGKMGNDDFGRLLLKTLKDNNVEPLVPELTFARKPGADMLLSEEDVERADISEWDIVHAGSVSQSGGASSTERDAVLLALKKAKAADKLVSFDINYRDKIWGVDDCMKESEKIYPLTDLLKISEEELVFAGGEDNIPAFMKEYDITVTVLTRGGEGARIYYYKKNDAQEAAADWTATADPDVFYQEIEAMKVIKVVDTTGAGDAYWGGFLSSLLMQGVKGTGDISMDKLEIAGRYGAVSGGLCIQKSGGIPAIPAREEIEAVFNS